MCVDAGGSWCSISEAMGCPIRPHRSNKITGATLRASLTR